LEQQPIVSQELLIVEVTRSHSDTPHSLRLLWTSDQPDACVGLITRHTDL